jgi:hypothetical protein
MGGERREPGEAEVSFYCGATGTGKTYLALFHFKRLLQATGRSGIIVDGMGERRNLGPYRAAYGVRDLSGCLDMAYRQGRHVVWMPRSLDEVEEFSDKAHALGIAEKPVTILFDETSPWMSSYRQPVALMLLLRAHYHNRCDVLMTTQYLARDFPPLALNCVQNAYIFRNTSPQALQRIAETFPDIDVDAVRKLPDRQYVEIHV